VELGIQEEVEVARRLNEVNTSIGCCKSLQGATYDSASSIGVQVGVNVSLGADLSAKPGFQRVLVWKQTVHVDDIQYVIVFLQLLFEFAAELTNFLDEKIFIALFIFVVEAVDCLVDETLSEIVCLQEVK